MSGGRRWGGGVRAVMWRASLDGEKNHSHGPTLLGDSGVVRQFAHCHTAAILSRETRKALFYHAKPRGGNHGGEAWRGKTKLFWSLSGQYGRRVTRAN